MTLRIPVIVSRLVMGFILALSVLSSAVSAQEDATLVLWVDQALAPVLERAANDFERDWGMPVAIEVFEDRGMIRETFPEVMETPDAPDIITLSDDWIQDLLPDHLAPIDLRDKADDFFPLTIRAYTYGDQIYGMPYNVVNLALVRNPELVPDQPQTWDEVLEISAALRESGQAEHGLVLQDDDIYHFLPIITAYGGYLVGMTDDGTWNTRDIGLNNDGAIMALEWLARGTQAGVFDLDLDWETAHTLFSESHAAMIITGPWAYWFFEQTGVPVVVSPLPAGTQPASPYVHMEGFQINAHSDKIDAAQAFLVDYVATTEIMAGIADHVMGFPPHAEAFELLENPAELGWAMAASNGQLYPDPRIVDPLYDPMLDAMQTVRRGERSPADALNGVVEQYLREHD